MKRRREKQAHKMMWLYDGNTAAIPDWVLQFALAPGTYAIFFDPAREKS